MSVDLSAGAIDRRLREASRLAGSLRPEHRLETKIDLRGSAVAGRLREASELLELCRALSRGGGLPVVVHLRAFRAADGDACCALINQAIQTIDGLNAAARAFMAAKNVPEMLEKDLVRAFVLVAVGEAGPVGIGALEDDEIRRIYVDPNSQRKGVGRAIVNALEAEARRRNLGALTVQASPSSVPFYRSLGYQGEERVISRRGDAEFTHVRMSKPLR